MNTSPKANYDYYYVGEDIETTLHVLSNDQDHDGDALEIISITNASHGFVSINDDGTIQYVSANNYSGSDRFTYTISDGNGGTSTVGVGLYVYPTNDAPIVIGENAITEEDTPVTIDVLANDSDPEGNSISVSRAWAEYGSVNINNDGTITYRPSKNYHGDDWVTYTVRDQFGAETEGSAYVRTTPLNDAPTGYGPNLTTNEDVAVTFDPLTTVTDIDGDALSIVGVEDPANGSLYINMDQTLTYIPDANAHVNEWITYTIGDGNGAEIDISAYVRVNAVNDAPNVIGTNLYTQEDTRITFDPLKNATDADGDVLHVSSYENPENGKLYLNFDGTMTYIPDSEFSGGNWLEYTVSDGNGGETDVMTYVNVSYVNDAPTAKGENLTANADQWFVFDATLNDTDPEGDALYLETVGTANNGQVAVSAEGHINYLPNEGFTGYDWFTYTIRDSWGAESNEAYAFIHVV